MKTLFSLAMYAALIASYWASTVEGYEAFGVFALIFTWIAIVLISIGLCITDAHAEMRKEYRKSSWLSRTSSYPMAGFMVFTLIMTGSPITAAVYLLVVIAGKTVCLGK